MKRILIVISAVVSVLCIFVSCSAISNIDDSSTTAVTDEWDTTHYYEIVENENTTAFVEIVTEKSGKPVTNKNGDYVTKEHTTIFTTKRNDTTALTTAEDVKVAGSEASSTEGSADNVVELETATGNSTTTTEHTTMTTTTTKKETTIVTETTTKVVTDKDGWIDKWY